METLRLQFDVAVVGGGITGAAIAAALVEQGVRVALLERGTCGAQGASAYSGGIVRIYDTDPDLMRLAAYARQCRRDTGYGRALDQCVTRSGVVYIAPEAGEAAMRAAIADYGSGVYPMRMLGAGVLRDVSGLATARPGCVALLEEDGGAGNVRASVHSMAALVRRGGGAVLEHCAVLGIERIGGPGGGVRLQLAQGCIEAGVAVLAAGAWGAALLPELGLQTRSIPLPRMMASAPPLMPIIDTAAATYVVPLHGRLVHVGTQLRGSAALPERLPRPHPEAGDDARRRLSLLSGRPETGPVLDVLPGYDAYAADGKPVIGFLGPEDPCYVAAGMAGIGYKLAPAVARIAAQDIALRLGRHDWTAQHHGDALARPFRPARLLRAEVAA
jgi:glycine/D-amino acid oxidase-like deaminating enzyme